MPSTQPRCCKWQEGEGHITGATGFCWLLEADGYSEKERLPREMTVHLSKWAF